MAQKTPRKAPASGWDTGAPSAPLAAPLSSREGRAPLSIRSAGLANPRPRALEPPCAHRLRGTETGTGNGEGARLPRARERPPSPRMGTPRPERRAQLAAPDSPARPQPPPPIQIPRPAAAPPGAPSPAEAQAQLIESEAGGKGLARRGPPRPSSAPLSRPGWHLLRRHPQRAAD